MKTAAKKRPTAPTPVAFRDVEYELARRLKAVQGPGDSPVLRACMSNLVIYCGGAESAEKIAAEVATVVALHPARVLLLVAEAGPEAGEFTSSVRVWGRVIDPGRWVCSEEVTLHATGRAVERLPSAVRTLLIGDLPTSLWWAVPQPPPLAANLLYDLLEHTEQIIYDSIGWAEPARGVVATAAWLAQMERGPGQGRWRVASDLNWRRLKYWRRLLAQSLDPAISPGTLESITEVVLEHGPHAVIQAWELVSWLASRLGWHVQEGKVQPGVEIAWQFTGARGPVQVRIRRLDQGPPAIRHLRITSTQDHQLAVLNLAVADAEGRLAALPEATGVAPRTVTVPPQPLAELVGQQLADRERDPAFRESMAVARVLAQSVLGGV
jgi:glucose-6-phosphate dehydrogenase assembly protein OpcA